MTIHREGHKIIRNIFIILFVLDVIFFNVFQRHELLLWILLSASVVFFLFVVFFFRVPGRPVIKDEQNILSPAEGTIVAIEQVKETLYFNELKTQVSIFMSPLDSHMNICPLDGTLCFRKHEPGKYWVAWHPKSSIENERTSVVIRHHSGQEVMVRQIAGAVARRIVTYPEINEQMEQGEELGFIKFGSRVDIFLPPDVHLNIALNQKVKAGTTVIARLANTQ